MGFMGAFCLAYARVWRNPDLSPWQVMFMFAFLLVSGGDHAQKALAARKERKSRGKLKWDGVVIWERWKDGDVYH